MVQTDPGSCQVPQIFLSGSSFGIHSEFFRDIRLICFPKKMRKWHFQRFWTAKISALRFAPGRVFGHPEQAKPRPKASQSIRKNQSAPIGGVGSGVDVMGQAPPVQQGGATLLSAKNDEEIC